MENRIRFFNTLTRNIELFVPNEDGKVKMYTCGPTVYHYAHIGNLRSYIMEDILEKTLRYVGSNKNIGIGCADGRTGKGEIHTIPGSDNMWSIGKEAFMERMTESTKGTIDHFAGHVSYINVMRNMSVSCDCEGCEAEPVVTPDVGILAGYDILAVDNACVDVIYNLPEGGGKAMIERVETRHGLRQLSYMKELGMGNDLYTIIDIDNGDAKITVEDITRGIEPVWTPDEFNTFLGRNKARIK